MRIVTIIFMCLIVILGVMFAILNAEPVHINFYIGSATMPVSLLIVLTFTTGLILGLLICAIVYLKIKRKNSRLRSQIKMLDKEIENLRAIPLKDAP